MVPAPRQITVRAACIAVLALLLLGAGRAEAITLPADFQDSFVANAAQPTSLAFVPGGRLLIAEEAGVRARATRTAPSTQPGARHPGARACSDEERGLMAVAVDPPSRRTTSSTSTTRGERYGCGATTTANTSGQPRVAVRAARRRHGRPRRETVLIDNIPAPQSYHIGADLQFGKDGLLYVSHRRRRLRLRGRQSAAWSCNDAARDGLVLLGKVLRVTRDGAIPAGNPWQGAGTARCNVTGRDRPGDAVPGDLRVGPAQPVPAGRSIPTPRPPVSSSTTSARSPGRRSTWARPARTTAGTLREGLCAHRLDYGLRRPAGRA